MKQVNKISKYETIKLTPIKNCYRLNLINNGVPMQKYQELKTTTIIYHIFLMLNFPPQPLPIT